MCEVLCFEFDDGRRCAGLGFMTGGGESLLNFGFGCTDFGPLVRGAGRGVGSWPTFLAGVSAA